MFPLFVRIRKIARANFTFFAGLFRQRKAMFNILCTCVMAPSRWKRTRRVLLLDGGFVVDHGHSAVAFP